MPRTRHNSLAQCPFCGLTGTRKGLPGHVSKTHDAARLPQWRELKPDRWTLDAGSDYQPAADVAPITDNPQAPPYWWYVKPPLGGRYHSRTIVKSGLAYSVPEARAKAYQEWLPLWRTGRNIPDAGATG